MNDLISRQAAIDALGEAPKVWTDSPEEFAALSQWEMDVTAIEAVPSEEIVRCGKCIHWDESAGMGDHRWCRLLKVSMTAADYCSHGEGGKA